ncbi:DUF1345 domain-containing protein [Microbispora sp. ATCC PTA-5024]|uniref:DUF1345 domain-containing protein n=1 Tax=Microbispora sp. ATCC PTA-5024 TaxID=316330 RepID=UPI0003DC78B8|nr:DUF1345 domain-containing protein [Microbispora sp. ATCC PTA-5024]ETK36296.1 hypothetical protein MPTA5024_09510 [Microbispora sp. ATCC PTA-5024]
MTGDEVPVWLRETEAEGRWTAAGAVILVILIHIWLPDTLDVQPPWLMPVLESALLVGLVAANPITLTRESRLTRAASLTLIGAISAANAWIILREVVRLVDGVEHDAMRLLTTGAAVWAVNVLLFALWYWELDRGGPVARSRGGATGRGLYPAFLFPQMDEQTLARPGWRATFVDYLYLAFTNATAFSPTDVMPLTRWAKVMMMLQSALSLVVVALVIARAVNVLG